MDGPITPGSEIPPWSGFCEPIQPEQLEQPIQPEVPKQDLTEEWLGDEQPPVDVLRYVGLNQCFFLPTPRSWLEVTGVIKTIGTA